MLKVAIVEDDQEIRNTLKAIVSSFNDLKCTEAYPDAEHYLADNQSEVPDVVLMDINLPGMNGIECVKHAKSIHPESQFMMLTALEDSNKIFDSLCAGATGYLLKHTTPSKLHEAIYELHRGGSPMSAQIARLVVNSFQSQPLRQTADYGELTERERGILDLLAQGFRYKEIGDRLFISTETVRTHIRNIYDKLQVHSRIDALNKVFGSTGSKK